MSNFKERAKWLPNCRKFIKQLLVSISSYITLPFFCYKNDGTRLFFKKNYSEKQDDLIFDGTSSGYFSRIEKLLCGIVLDDTVIIDLGCGQGALFNWLESNAVTYKEYIGIDFAISQKATTKAKYICDNISNLEKYMPDNLCLIVMSNALCYIDDLLFLRILSALKRGDSILIIEPSPNIFWDAHFNGIKPLYRPIDTTCTFLQNCGYKIMNTFQDYLLGKLNHYYIELSYGIYATKEDTIQ